MEILNSWEIGADASHLERKLLQELEALEAANIHSIISTEDQANEIISQIDRAKDQLEDIDGWLNHYTHVLDSMGADVQQVEVRSKTLQIASANQKVLLQEVEKLTSKMKLPGYIVEILKHEPLEFADGVLQCEDATDRLTEIIKAKFENGLSDMNAVKERVLLFQGYANEFAERLSTYLFGYFTSQANAFIQDEARTSRKGNLKLYGHEVLEEKIFRFRKLLLWLKSTEARKFHELQMKYTQEIGRVYSREIHLLFEQARQHHILKVNSLEAPYLFIPISSVSSAATNALSAGAKNVLKSGKALSGISKVKKMMSNDSSAESPLLKLIDVHRNTSERSSVVSLEIGADEKISPEYVFGDTLTMLLPFIIREQNLIMDIFAFRAASETKTTVREWQEDLSNKSREPLKDVKLQRMIQDLMDELFGQFKEEIMGIIDIGVRLDQSIALGMASRTEEHLKETENTANVWLCTLLGSIHKKLLGIYKKFVEDQQKIIEDTKVNSKRRTGLLPIFKTFPMFLDKMESYIHVADGSVVTRTTANQSYEKIIKTLFETLDAVVRDNNGNDKSNLDDKEQVNAHIMIIENMHFISSEIRARRIPALDVYVKQAKATYDMNLNIYCKTVIRKPLGKLLEFFEGIEQLLKTQQPEEVSFNLSFSKTAVKEVVKKYPGKEVCKGLEALYKRADKHFSGEDGDGCGQLLQVVWRGIQEEVVSSLRRYEEMLDRCYHDSGIRLELTVDEILTSFSDLAVTNH